MTSPLQPTGGPTPSSTPENSRTLRIMVIAFVGAGLVLLLASAGLPIVRNAFIYAKIALNIIANGFNPVTVAQHIELSYGKPIFFGAFASPLVWIFGANVGMKLASFMGAAFFLATVALALPRLNRRRNLNPGLAPLEFLFVALSPLVLYQFWSAYPDGLFAGLVILAFVLTDIIATEPERDTRRHIIGLGVVIYLAIHTKLYGAVLGLACPIYMLMHAKPWLARATRRGAKIALLATVFGLLALVLILAKLDLNPLLDFAAEDPFGFGGYVSGIANPTGQLFRDSSTLFLFSLVVTFQLALLFLLTKKAWRAWSLAPTVFALIYLLGLFPFGGSAYNMRYMLPLFPFFAVALAAGAESIPRAARRVMLGAYGAVAVTLILVFNIIPIYKKATPQIAKITAQNPRLGQWLDNLRMPEHLRLAAEIADVNRTVPENGTLYWTSGYYGSSTHVVAGHLGIRPDIDIKYALSGRFVAPPSGTVFMTSYPPSSSLYDLPSWASVRAVAPGVGRLVPLGLQLSSVSGDYVAAGKPIQVRAEPVAGADIRIVGVEFLNGETSLAVDAEAPYETTWQAPPAGRHEIGARVIDSDGDTVTAQPTVVFVGKRAIERSVGRSDDDGMESDEGVFLPLARLDLGESRGGGKRVVGVRFAGLGLDRGSHVAKAYLEFTAAAPGPDAATFEIRAEKAGDAVPLAASPANFTKRPQTDASVTWSPEPWAKAGQQGEKQRTPDLAPLVDEILAQADWKPGNAMLFVIRGTGRRAVGAFDGAPGSAPRLYIELR